MGRMTVRDFLAAKGRRQLTQTFTVKAEEASAASAAGIDVLVTPQRFVETIRPAASGVFLVSAIDLNAPAESDAIAIRLGFEALDAGADAVYCGAHNLQRVKAMAEACIPVIGHVGLVPYRDTWFGGKRAVGKTADEAMAVYERTLGYQQAGAIAVEMEVVPHQMASEISRRVELIVISMGSGSGCDGQYLFATDILGTNTGHVPRHAKRYRDLHAEYERLRGEMAAAFGEFKADVISGAYPQPNQLVDADAGELKAFRGRLGG